MATETQEFLNLLVLHLGTLNLRLDGSRRNSDARGRLGSDRTSLAFLEGLVLYKNVMSFNGEPTVLLHTLTMPWSLLQLDH